MSEEPLEYEAQEPLPYIPSASFQQDAPVSPIVRPDEHTILISPEPSLPIVSMHIQKKSRRGLWIAMSIIVLLLVSIPAFFTIRYINRSTPDKTLTTFCSALQQQDYQSAYNQFSPNLQKTFSEATFASNFSPNTVKACTYTAIRSNGNKVTTSMQIAHDYVGTNNDVIILSANNDQVWKIDDFYRV